MKAKVTITAMLAVLLAAIAAAPDRAQAQASDAMAILKAMSDYVSSQKTIELTFDSDIEVITPQLEKIQFTNSGEALLSRPDKLRAHRVGGYADVAFTFDGKTASVFGKHINGYAQFDAPGSVDQLIEALRAGHGVALPGADLLLSNAYDVLMAGVKEFKHIGRGVIDGLECEHLAFRNFDTDWQLWVEVGERPIPRKLVITSKTLNSAPQYTLRIKGWKTEIRRGDRREGLGVERLVGPARRPGHDKLAGVGGRQTQGAQVAAATGAYYRGSISGRVPEAVG